MENIIDQFKDKAREFCERQIHGWFDLKNSTQAWYIGTVARLLMENKDYVKEMLGARLN